MLNENCRDSEVEKAGIQGGNAYFLSAAKYGCKRRNVALFSAENIIFFTREMYLILPAVLLRWFFPWVGQFKLIINLSFPSRLVAHQVPRHT